MQISVKFVTAIVKKKAPPIYLISENIKFGYSPTLVSNNGTSELKVCKTVFYSYF